METIFWILSKILWQLLAPEKVVLFLLFLGTVLLWTRRNRVGRWMISIASLIFLVPTLLPVSNFLLWPLEDRFTAPVELPKNISGIIALGGAERAVITSTRGQPSINDGAERLTTFVSLAHRYPDARLIHAGGTGSLTQQNYKTNETARQFFMQLGLNTDRVLFDSQARNTAENATNSLKLLGKKPEGNWVLITSAYHMPRSVGIFRKIGWNVIPYPVDYKTAGQWRLDWKFAILHNFRMFSKGLHEWTGLFVYWVTDKTSEFFPKPKP